jgi:hypothetical protein
MAAFEFFWASLLRHRQASVARVDSESTQIPASEVWILGYSLFVWTTVGELVLLVNPDLLVMASVLLAAGLLLRMQTDRNSRTPSTGGLGFAWDLAIWRRRFSFPWHSFSL